MLILLLLLYILISIIHITIAKKLGIYDKPNSRSSHNFQTLNGGGIIFPISFLIPIIFILNIHEYVNLIIGTSLITLISLKDDLKPIKNSIRILIHLISVLFLLNHFNLSEISIFTLLISFILITGILNSYNFMDGINGLNGSYSLISLLSLLYYNIYFHFTENILIQSLIISVMVFLFLNFRKKAIVFSGDVGSISIAYIISFFVFNLILIDQNIKWILLFGIYGLDSVGTIVLRIIRKENIFKAHRSHFYQFLTNEKKISHLVVSFVYCFIQLFLNIIIFKNSNLEIMAIYALLIIIYIILRLNFEGSYRLFKNYN